eukprot:10966900-Ditylum_brightwellii.AAC.1
MAKCIRNMAFKAALLLSLTIVSNASQHHNALINMEALNSGKEKKSNEDARNTQDQQLILPKTFVFEDSGHNKIPSENNADNDGKVYTKTPSSSPSTTPTVTPTNSPSTIPSVQPSSAPTTNHSSSPTFIPTVKPSKFPSVNPTYTPTKMSS